MGATAVLAAAVLLLVAGCWDRSLLARLDPVVGGWVAAVAGWPIVAIYVVAPLLWSDASAAGSLFTVLLYTPAVGYGLVQAGRALMRQRIVVDPAAAVLASLFVSAGAAMLIDGSGKLVNLVVAAAMYAGLVLRARSISLAAIGDAARIVLVGAVVALLAAVLVNPAEILGDCRADKCTELGAALTSPFAGNGNLAGIMVTVLLPLAAYRAAPARVVAAVLGVAAVGLLAGSRTAFIGIGVAAVGSLLLSAAPRSRPRAVALGGLFTGAAVLSFLPLYVGYAETDFSLRGYLWNQARALIPDQLVFGHDPAYWVDSGRSTLFVANYSPHNGWFEIVVSTGLWGAVVVVAAAVIKSRSVGPAERPWLVAYFATILSISSLEAVFVPYFLGIAPFAAILPFLVYRMPAERSAAEHPKESV
ncbi:MULTISPECIES: O-antigen ligase family protein [Gordonia]|uniref:O-antigen ligase family protein n=1 Tax=Gordonia TaxID=2053 RepID=UPI003266D55F